MEFPVCDLIYTRSGYVPVPWYAPVFLLPDPWGDCIKLTYTSPGDQTETVNFLAESPEPNSFLVYCDILDPQAALDALKNNAPPVVCVPDPQRLAEDSLYKDAVRQFNQAVVKHALKRKAAVTAMWGDETWSSIQP